MDDANIYDQLTPMFRQVLGVPDLVLTAELSAADVPAWDSFANINIIVGAEMIFGIRLSTSDIEGLQCVGDLVAMIKDKAR